MLYISPAKITNFYDGKAEVMKVAKTHFIAKSNSVYAIELNDVSIDNDTIRSKIRDHLIYRIFLVLESNSANLTCCGH